MSKRRRVTMWVLVILLLIALIGFFALRVAIASNGAAVLNTVDRITGGSPAVELVHSSEYGDASAQKVRVYAPEKRSAKPLPVIIFEHGGSWSSGDPDDYGFIGRALVPEGFIIVLAGYRLHPEVQFPAMLEDTASAIAWTRNNIAEYGGDPDRIVLAGHSAGAYNVVMTVLDQNWLEQAGVPESAIAGVIGLAGPYDFYPFDSDSTKASFGAAPDPKKTQPINAARGDAPPMLFIHGEKDTTVRPRNSRILAEAIKQAGGSAVAVFRPEMDHVRPLMALASPYRRDPLVQDTVSSFAKAVTSKTKVSVPVQDQGR